MKRVRLQDDWLESWKLSYHYDLLEVYGEGSHIAYAYAYRNRLTKTLDLITEVLPPGSTILDVAAAQGNFSLLLAERGYRVTWNDLRSDLIDYVRLKHERGELQYVAGNVFELQVTEPFDAVLITEIIEHVAHPDDFLRRIAALVRPGGYVIMTTPNGAYFRNRLPKFSECEDPSLYESRQFQPDGDGHIFLLWPEEIKRLAEQTGLTLQVLSFFTNSLTIGHVKMAALLKLLPGWLVLLIERGSQRVLPVALKRRLMVSTAARFQRMPAVPTVQ